MFSRPGSVMGGGGGTGSRLGYYGSLPTFGGSGQSRPPSGMSTIPGGPSTTANRWIIYFAFLWNYDYALIY